MLNGLFSKVEEEIVQYLIHYQFSGTDVALLKELNRQKEIMDTIKLLIGESMIKVADTEEFKSLLQEILRENEFSSPGSVKPNCRLSKKIKRIWKSRKTRFGDRI
ncbi:hypothetical protein LEP1GSC037_4079 [Leptospira interrogans str. 2006001854]|uniref:Uncharacterized protein n=1 Tax=Leptospira interrogans str. 2006001854 TaxID=1001590 RepID=M6G701_LEPIR|nr:hypothetical protein LEP1GSC037_4079 [Leptospira interrogans str. 2006001854]